MSRETHDDVLAVACLVALAFLLVLLSAPDVIARGIEWVLS